MTDRERQKMAVFIRLAADLASLSRCRRLRVGCVIIRPDYSEVLAIGYNGPKAGSDNDSCRSSEGSCGCVHSEANALVKLRTSETCLMMVTTHSPCEHCAGLIVNSGRIGRVIYDKDYRDDAGVRSLRESHVVVKKIDPALSEGSGTG